MMEIASRPLLLPSPANALHRLPDTTSLLGRSPNSDNNTSFSFPSTKFPPVFAFARGRLPDPSRAHRLSHPTTARRYSLHCPTITSSSSIPPITHDKGPVRGLQTPSPEMTALNSRTSLSYRTNGIHVFLKALDLPTPITECARLRRNNSKNPHIRTKQTCPMTRSSSPPPPMSPSTTVDSAICNLNSQPDHIPRPKRLRSSVKNVATVLVPSNINSSGAPLPDFAAQITCLSWFESAALLESIESSTINNLPPLKPLAQNAIPSPGFSNWINQILAVTQVSPNVVILALLFVHRLKKKYPDVQGKPGSEFRLFTVALMLGNKYLDDNTYTNKTWAEVSGINVEEIHIMEVEFLSKMRYSLYVGEKEWKDWHGILRLLGEYWRKASVLPVVTAKPQIRKQHQQDPARRWSIPLQLPSPPSSTSSSPLYMGNDLDTHPGRTAPLVPGPIPLDPPIHPTIQTSEYESISRKRSFDYNGAMQPPTKRFSRSSIPRLSLCVSQFSSAQTPSPSHPIPPTHMNTLPRLQPQPSPVRSQSQQTQLPLPVSRSMSIAFPLPTVTSTSPSDHPAGLFNFSPYNGQRQTSPYSAYHSVSSSPVTPMPGTQRSPNWILGHRDSPYRPVRGVNTLLVPPHSAEHNIGCDQMHYQPLPKAKSKYKTGVVPYMHPEVSWSPCWHDPFYYG